MLLYPYIHKHAHMYTQKVSKGSDLCISSITIISNI